MQCLAKELTDRRDADEMLSRVERKMIFGKLEPILQQHTKILRRLHKALEKWREEREIGRIYLKVVRFRHAYCEI